MRVYPIRKIIEYAITAKEQIAIVLSFVPAAWAFWGGLMDGFPAIVQLILALAVVSFTTFFLAGLLVVSDVWLRSYGDKKDMNDAADKLQDMSDTGTEYLPIGMIAEIWSGDNVEKIHVFNPRLRRIKRAVKEGKIKRRCGIIITQTVTSATFDDRLKLEDVGDFKSTPNMNTPVMLDSVIASLRKGDL
jgi:hypothetical protein